MQTAIVYVEQANASVMRSGLEALGAARGIAAQAIAVLSGPGASQAAPAVGKAGASRAVVLSGEGHSPDAVARALADLVREHGATALIASASSTGGDIAPRAAALLDSPLFSDCTALAGSEGAVSITRPLLAGKVIATMGCDAPVLVATVRRNAFAPFDMGKEECELEVVQSDASAEDGLAVQTGIEPKPAGKLDVAEAPIVVSGGRGLGESGNFGIIEDLADAFGGAAVGASRAVVDAGWRPHAEQVGQTGKTVSPKLYVAVGISGAIQHLAGMKTSRTIVAINKDADAPIFKVADYGIVGDAFEVVPALAAAVRAARADG